MTPYESAFRRYFHNALDDMLDSVVAKAREYGTTELEQYGGTIRYVTGLPENQNLNLMTACWAYACGKMARWTAAVHRGERPSDDTVRDVLVYALMTLKVSETGEWFDHVADVQSQNHPSAGEELAFDQAMALANDSDEDEDEDTANESQDSVDEDDA